ncbi:MAG: redoxin domain-containing protein [Actinomycetota bacterium]|nr:redoxin domain-containing protein [Actinomycetota bacterium]
MGTRRRTRRIPADRHCPPARRSRVPPGRPCEPFFCVWAGPWQGPDIGDPLPAFSAPTPDGSMVSTEAFGGQPRVLVFVSAGCGPCHALMEELAGARDLSGAVTVVTQREDLQALGVPKGVTVLLQDGREMEDLLGLVSSPFGITLTQAGIVADKRVPNTTDHLRELLSTARQVHPLAKH